MRCWRVPLRSTLKIVLSARHKGDKLKGAIFAKFRCNLLKAGATFPCNLPNRGAIERSPLLIDSSDRAIVIGQELHRDLARVAPRHRLCTAKFCQNCTASWPP